MNNPNSNNETLKPIDDYEQTPLFDDFDEDSDPENFDDETEAILDGLLKDEGS